MSKRSQKFIIKLSIITALVLTSAVFFIPTSQAQKIQKTVNQNSSVIEKGASEEIPDPCKSAEPQGMTRDYRECSLSCNTVCSYKTTVDEVNCFACQQGGDDTCKDIGQLDFPHPWCNPGGVCYDSPDLVCAAPFGALGPNRSKLTCTNCKKRPDMCWQKVKDGTNSLTNCRLGCWNGTCKYVGKYKEKEWDGSDEFLHCYECITPPPPPTCEDLKWGTDWKSDCLNICAAPGYCEEFEFEVGKKNPKACVDVDTSVKKGEKDDEEEGTRTRGGGGGQGGGKPPKPGSGINDPTKPFGPNETAEGTKTRTPCEEVADELVDRDDPNYGLAQSEIDGRARWVERFKKSYKKYSDRAVQVNSAINKQKSKVSSIGGPLNEAAAELKKAKVAAKGAENLGSYGKQRLKELDTAQKEFNKLNTEYTEAKKHLTTLQADLGKELNGLKREAMRDYYQANPQAKAAEEINRVGQYESVSRDLARLEASKEVSQRVFDQKAQDLKQKITQGGDKAEGYKTQLENLERGRREWNDSQSRREQNLKRQINRMRKENGEDGVGPYDEKTFHQGAYNAAWEVNKQLNRLKALKRKLQKAADNNCPPKGADKLVKEIDKKIKDLETAVKNLENRAIDIEKGFPMTPSDLEGMENNIARFAEGSKNQGGVRSTASFYLESLAEETKETITDPSVAFDKAYWFGVGTVKGIYNAVEGLIKLGIGAADLTAETLAKYLGYEDGGIFGSDSSKVMEGLMGALDGNLNLDGVEKLAQTIDRAADKYLTNLSKKSEKTYRKELAEGGGKVLGEVIIGDKLIGKGIQLGRGAGAVDNLASGTKVRGAGGKTGKVPKGGKTTTGPPKTPKLADDVPNPSTLDGIADDVAQTGSKGTPKQPRAPSQHAKDFKGDRLPDQTGVKPKPLGEDTAKLLEKENGFRADHAENMNQFAQEKGVFLVVRDGNPDSVKFMNKDNMMPKPMSSKAKTAKAGPETNKGLVVDPTHPTQSKYWDQDIAAAKASGDTKKVAWLEENRAKAVKTWKSYGDEMKGNGYSVNKETGVVEYTDPITGKHFDGVHGDYDLHGVFKPGVNGAAPKKVSFGAGKKFDQNGIDVEGRALRSQLNDAIDPKKRYVQHGGQDDWVPDPKKIPNKPPDPPVTVFRPDGGPPVRLETPADMKKFYQEEMGVRWEYPDPKPKPGAPLKLPSFEFLDQLEMINQGIEKIRQVKRIIQTVYAFC